MYQFLYTKAPKSQFKIDYNILVSLKSLQSPFFFFFRFTDFYLCTLGLEVRYPLNH